MVKETCGCALQTITEKGNFVLELSNTFVLVHLVQALLLLTK